MKRTLIFILLAISSATWTAAISHNAPTDAMAEDRPNNESLANSPHEVVISGTIVDASTGTAIAGAHVTAHGHSRYSAMTDEAGAYTLTRPTYVTLLDFTAPGYNLVQKAVTTERATVSLYRETFATDSHYDQCLRLCV